MDNATIHANGIDIFYRRTGAGEPLLLISGLGGHSGGWALNQPEFAKHFDTIAHDNRGAGQTSAPDEPYTIRGMADDAAAMLDELGIARAHVVGVSMGGMVAQELAINYPDKVGRLVIACSRARASQLRRTIAVAQRALWEAGVPREAITAIQQPWGSTPQVLQDEQLPMDALALQAADPYLIQPHAYLRQLDATIEHDTYDRLGQVKSPTLALVGSEDVLTPPFESEEIARLIPGAKLRILPRGGHGFSREYPAQFSRAVLQFLQARD